jgi:hypothetical protein
MRKHLLPLAGVAALGVAAASPAQAQAPGTTIKVDARVSPNTAGTKKKPRGVKLRVKVKWSTPGDVEKPVVTSADVLFPKGSLYRGSHYKKCSLSQMEREGLDACSSKSIMGSGTASAWADTVKTHPKITVVNAGGRDVCLWTVMTNPARVSACVTGKITKQRGKWAYKLHLEVPRNLQIVAGVPIALESFDLTAGGKSYAKDWLATTSCSGGKWAFQVETFFSTGGSSTYEDSVKCKSPKSKKSMRKRSSKKHKRH